MLTIEGSLTHSTLPLSKTLTLTLGATYSSEQLPPKSGAHIFSEFFMVTKFLIFNQLSTEESIIGNTDIQKADFDEK